MIATAPVSDVQPGVALAPEHAKQILQQYNQEGCVKVGPVLTAEEADDLRVRVDRLFADPTAADRHMLYGTFVAVRLFEHDKAFRDLLLREPMRSLLDQLLGDNCHLVANNLVRNAPGQAIDRFHVDDFVWMPLPEDLPRHDARMQMPNFLVNVQIALTDIETVEHGALQYVPGSHYSGRQPNDLKEPSFEGRGPVTVLARKGEMYLQHPQVWHRGAPNSSDRTRYLLQYAHGVRFVAQRFFPFLNYHMPDYVLQGADETMLRVLGKHPKGAYG